MKEIGGYFELELNKIDNMPNKEGVLVNSGRNALEYILRGIGVDKIGMLYVPRYTCEVIYEPIRKLGIKNVKKYEINENLEIDDFPRLREGDYVIANNYFGIKDSYIHSLIERFGEHLIVDNSQALYYPIHGETKAFYSPRKFAGVPDGGIAWPSCSIEMNTDTSYDKCSHLLKRLDIDANAAYEDFHINSDKLKEMPLKKMSRLTESLLGNIDFDVIRDCRKRNYDILREELEHMNLLDTPESSELSCPMVYPYRTMDKGMRSRLIANKVYVAKYWPDIENSATRKDYASIMAEQILALPIDQRYGEEDMKNIINIIKG